MVDQAVETIVWELSPWEIDARTAEIVHVYGQAFAGPPYEKSAEQVAYFSRILNQHRTYPGFQMVGARFAIQAGEGPLVGFAYGYHSLPDQWWHGVVRPALGLEAASLWLADAFELVELAVLPSHQGLGIGSRLHDTLLAGRIERTAVLSTIALESKARHLYRRRGWTLLLASLQFPGTASPYAVMGRRLRQE